MRRARSHDSLAEGPVTLGRERRGAIARRKNAADLLFLFGLLTGGPLVTFDIQHSLGLVSMLGAGVTSALVGCTAFSIPGAFLTGVLSALTMVTAVFGPPGPADDEDSDTTGWRETPMWAGRHANSNGTEPLWRHGAAVR